MMFCPFIKDECRENCTFRHMARGSSGNMVQSTSHCVLAIAADELDQYLLMKIQQEEDQNS